MLTHTGWPGDYQAGQTMRL